VNPDLVRTEDAAAAGGELIEDFALLGREMRRWNFENAIHDDALPRAGQDGIGQRIAPCRGVKLPRRIAFTAASTLRPTGGALAGAPSLRIIVKSEEPVRRPRQTEILA
jgi:hypothetical protein